MVIASEIEVQTVRAVAPEDVREGDVVVVLHEIDQILGRVSGSGEVAGTLPEFKVVRARSMPNFLRPLRVIAVALPVVLVEDTDGDESLVDVRLKELGRLPAALGVRVMRRLDERRREEAAQKAAEKTGAVSCEGAD